MDELKPWARKAFELIFHAELHWRSGSDYDKRLALISFDNSIEVSISVYLGLNPIQRGNRHYPKGDVQKWLHKYHTRLDFYEDELKKRSLPVHRNKAYIIWLHDQRNELYHGSSDSVPTLDTLENIRFVALWVYSVLFEDREIEKRLDEAINASGKLEHKPTEIVTKPSMSDLSDLLSSTEHADTLVSSSLLGKWDEANPDDMEIVKRLTNEF